MIIWSAKIKEVENEHILTPTYMIGSEEGKYLNEDFFVKFWGLKDPDVEWYTLEKEERDNSL